MTACTHRDLWSCTLTGSNNHVPLHLHQVWCQTQSQEDNNLLTTLPSTHSPPAIAHGCYRGFASRTESRRNVHCARHLSASSETDQYRSQNVHGELVIALLELPETSRPPSGTLPNPLAGFPGRPNLSPHNAPIPFTPKDRHTKQERDLNCDVWKLVKAPHLGDGH